MLRDHMIRGGVKRYSLAWVGALFASLVVASCAPPPAYADAVRSTCDGIPTVLEAAYGNMKNPERLLKVLDSATPEHQYIVRHTLGAYYSNVAAGGTGFGANSFINAGTILCVVTFGKDGKIA